MKTFRISEDEIKDLKPVAVGYKIFQNDWTAKSNGYDYKDEKGNVLNTIHKVDGDISECKWGLHFSLKPQDCFDFYESVQWNKFAKVEAYDRLLTCDKKCITNILKIVEIYTFDEFIRVIQEDLQNNVPNGVSWSDGVNRSNGVNLSNGVHGATGVHRSDGMYMSIGVSYSNGVSMSDGVYGSYGVNMSDGVNISYGVDNSEGVYGSYGVMECRGISRAVFCYKKSGELMAFNKRITEERNRYAETLAKYQMASGKEIIAQKKQAVKEFAEKLKKRTILYNGINVKYEAITADIIDELLKEYEE